MSRGIRRALVLISIVAAGGETALAATANKVEKIVVPTKVTAGKPFKVSVRVTLDKRVHKPPYDYLHSGLYSKRGTADCPRSVPVDRRGWTEIMRSDYSAGDSAHLEFGTRTEIAKAGRYRLCAYVFVWSSVETGANAYHTKARAAKLLRVRAA